MAARSRRLESMYHKLRLGRVSGLTAIPPRVLRRIKPGAPIAAKPKDEPSTQTREV